MTKEKDPSGDGYRPESAHAYDYVQSVRRHRDALRGSHVSDKEKRALLRELIVALEAAYKQGQQIYRQLGREPQLLEEIAQAHEELVMLSPSCDELLLDWAIASKRAGNIAACIRAHKMRMHLCPSYQVTDAVRLLGILSDRDDIEEIPTMGVFERCKDSRVYRPSPVARSLGCRIRMIFEEHEYNLSNCKTMLLPFINDDVLVDSDRIFSANSFFHHRHDLYHNPDTYMGGLGVLARLFLFGLAVSREQVQDSIGTDTLQCLIQAGLVRTSAICPADLVGEVQVFPVRPSDLFGQDKTRCCFFMTDWPMESLRVTRNAVMPVGYDTLELMSLSIARKSSDTQERLLDLCCGCGIQGIFAWNSACGGYSELVSADVNERACCFASANMALNMSLDDDCAYALLGDVYEKVEGTFGCIVSNPPFVAIPSSSCTDCPHTAPALYAVGGGIDGTEVLRRIVGDCVGYLQGKAASLLLVTELPNIETSCSLINSFLPEHVNACIRIAYVGHDVETVQQYVTIRQAEIPKNIATRDWKTEQLEGGVYNRALALISISLIGNSTQITLHKYGNSCPDNTDSEATCDLDEEDAFLTREGVQFARTCLLKHEH